MNGFTKLHSTILNSSIWNEADDTRIVWITMLAMADEDGTVKASMGGLAHQARKSIEATEKAIAVLEAPDKDSSRPHHEGRRIERVDGGWKVLNHGYYRELGMSDATREYWRKKQAERRQQLNVKDSQGQSRKHASASASVLEGEQEPDENAVTLPPRRHEPEPADARQLIPTANRIMARFNEVRGITYTSPAEINVCVELIATGATEAQLVEAMEYARKRYWKSDIKGDRQKFAPSFVFNGKVFPGLLAEAKKRRGL